MSDHDTTIKMESGVSMSDGQGFVTLQWGNQRGQLDVDEVRAHALKLLECAEAAESDALVFRALGAKDKATGAAALVMLREERAKGWPPRQRPPKEPKG